MNVTPEVMMQAVKERVQSAFPGEVVYEDLVPVDFERPSNMVELTAIKLDPLALGSGAVSLQYQYKITTFCVVDEVGDSHLPVLDLRAMTVMAAFAQGYVTAGSRAPKVTACSANTGFNDYAEVLLTLTLNVDRSEFCPEAVWPLMEELALKVSAGRAKQ